LSRVHHFSRDRATCHRAQSGRASGDFASSVKILGDSRNSRAGVDESFTTHSIYEYIDDESILTFAHVDEMIGYLDSFSMRIDRRGARFIQGADVGFGSQEIHGGHVVYGIAIV